MFNRFQRRLNEALASAVGGGIDAPIYTGDFGDDDHHFELTPEQVRAIYKWVERADSTILRPVLSVMEELTPELSSRLQVSPAGRGSTYFTGTADYKARWVVKHGDISYSTIESQVGAVLRNSDIWKALGVDYNRAQSFLNNSDFWYHGMRALAFKLNSMKHAGFWAHVSSGQIGRVVNRQIRLEIDRPNNNRLVYNPGHLRKIGVQWRVEPDSLKVSSGKRPSTLQVDHVPTAGLSYRGPDDVAPITLNSSGQHVLFLLVAQLSYDFVGSIDLIRGGGSDGFSALPVE